MISYLSPRYIHSSPSPPASGGEGWGEGGFRSRAWRRTPLTPTLSPPEAGGEGEDNRRARRIVDAPRQAPAAGGTRALFVGDAEGPPRRASAAGGADRLET